MYDARHACRFFENFCAILSGNHCWLRVQVRRAGIFVRYFKNLIIPSRRTMLRYYSSKLGLEAKDSVAKDGLLSPQGSPSMADDN